MSLATDFEDAKSQAEMRRQAAVALAREQFATARAASLAIYNNTVAALTARFEKVKDLDTVIAATIDTANAAHVSAVATAVAAAQSKRQSDLASLQAKDPKADLPAVDEVATAAGIPAVDPAAIEASIRMEEANARAALDAIGDYSDRDLRDQLGAAIDAADQQFHREVAAAAASLGVSHS